MGKKAPQPPPAPDPVVTARAQGEMNIETARTNAALNRINQVGPFGQITYHDLGREYANREVQHHIDAYSRGQWSDPYFIRNGNLDVGLLQQHFMRPENNPYVDQWEMRTELSPEQQELYRLSTDAQRQYGEAALQQFQGVQDRLAAPFDFNGPALRADLQDRTGGLMTSVPSRSGSLILNAPDQTGGLITSLPDRTGSMMLDVGDRTKNLTMELPDRTSGLISSLRNRTGDLQYDLPNRNNEIMRRPDFTGLGDPNQARDAVEAALLQRLNPQLERERASLEARLANQGIAAGTEAWREGFDDWNRMANDARLAAILNAGQEQSRLVQLGLAQSAFNNQAMQQAIDNERELGRFRNEAVGQASQMDLALGQFANNATRLASLMDLDLGQFKNSALGQALQMDVTRGRFINEALRLAAQMDADRAQFQNSAVGQSAQMDLARRQFINNAINQAAQMDLEQGQFQNSAIGQATQMDLALAAQQNAARQQALQEALALRVQPLNEAAALLSGDQIQVPMLAPVPQVGMQAPDYQGAVAQNYAGQMAAYNARMQQVSAQNAALGNLLGTLGGAAIWKWSDRRVKRDVVRIGTGRYGLPLYTWRYIWGGVGVGHMADEVARVRPDAVRIGADGLARVNYGALLP
jgi:hypothetical protein